MYVTLFVIFILQTSVLINPRETYFEDLTDEFSYEQSYPLEHVSPFFDEIKSIRIVDNKVQFSPKELKAHETSVNNLKAVYSEFIQIHRSATQHSKNYMLLHADQRKQPAPNINTTTDDILKCYSEVPDLFFKTDFSLRNPDIFDRVLGGMLQPAKVNDEGTENVDKEADDETSARNERKQEPLQLAYCLDLVEIALLKQICLKSPAFFRTIDDIRLLHEKVSEALKRTAVIQKYMKLTNANSVKLSLAIPAMQQKRTNCELLQVKLDSLRKVIDGRRTVLILLQSDDYLNALNVIVELLQLYETHQLHKIESVRSIEAELHKYQHFICDIMGNKFVSMAVQWTDEEPSHSIESDKAEKSDNVSSGDLESREYMKQLLLMLIKVNRFDNALLMFKRRITDDVQLIWRTCALEYLQVFDPTTAMSILQDGFNEDRDSSSNNSTLFIQRWRELPADSFLASLEMCFDSLKVSLIRYNNMHKYITFVIQNRRKENDAPHDAEVVNSNEIVDNGLLEISRSCITAACTHALKDTLNLMKFRTESNIAMELPQMKRLWSVTLDFIVCTEKIARTPASYDFKSYLTAQSKSFLYQLHDGYKAKLSSTLDMEKWTQCDVSPAYQQMITDLSSGVLFSKRNTNSVRTGVETNTIRSNSPAPNRRPTGSPAPAIRPAMIDSKSYNVPWSVLLLIEQVVDILDISECYPDMNVDIMSKIVILCQLFDQKTDKLVLGAEAMQMAGLKSISAKHLAFAAQSYELLLALIPHIRTFNKGNSTPNGRVGVRSSMSVLPSGGKSAKLDALDAVANSITEHHSAILTKFVRIVDDMMDSIAANRLRMHDWDKTTSSTTKSNKTMQVDYFEDIVKMINSLHKTLLQLLPVTQVIEVFSRIFNVLKIKLLQHFDVPDKTLMKNSGSASSTSFAKQPLSLTGKQRILDEINYFVLTLNRLKHVDSKWLMDLETMFKAKYGISADN